MSREHYPYINDIPSQALLAPSVQAQLRATHERGEVYAFFDEHFEEIDPKTIYRAELVAINGLLVARAILQQANAEDFYHQEDLDIACCHAWGSDVVRLGNFEPATLTGQPADYVLHTRQKSLKGDISVINAGLSECGLAFPTRNEERYVFVPASQSHISDTIDK